MKVRINKLDVVFSQLVRSRVNFTCEKCGKYFPEDSRGGLHCSHFFGRSRHSVRWAPSNAAAHCHGCHTYLGANPIEFTEWIKAHLGQQRYDLLRVEANTPKRWKTHEKEELYQEMKAELERMESIHLGGYAGRIEFELMREVASRLAPERDVPGQKFWATTWGTR